MHVGMLRPRALRPLGLCLVLALPAAVRAAPDCLGARVYSLRLAPDRVRLEASLTGPGMTPAGLLAGAGDLQVDLVDANDPATVLFSAAIPVTQFMTFGGGLRYDRSGTFTGSVLVRASKRQKDTVRISFRARAAAVTGLGVGREVRAVVTTGASCARTCVAQCAGSGACSPSAAYVPFADAGFGAYATAPHRATSPLCGLAIDAAAACDFLDEASCVLPYPSSYFLAADASTPTGLRVNYGPQALPANTSGKHIEPTDWNTLDGFSPGPMIMTVLADTGFPVDLLASNVAFHTNFARSLDADHPTVLLDAATGNRVVHFAELDANILDVARRALIIRPGRRLDDASRYIVALRNLVDTMGNPIRPRLAFRALRDGFTQTEIASACGTACGAAFAPRIPVFADIVQRLANAGVAAQDLILAWDFTTASTQALTGWMVSIRDQAFALPTPSFTVTNVDDGGGAGRDANIWARVSGTFQAPLFMKPDLNPSSGDAPGSRLNLVGGVPTQNGYATVPFVVDIPRIAVGLGGSRATLWGHGLVGSRTQIGTLSLLAQTYNFVVGGVDMQGMSSADVVPAIVPLVQDFSKFHWIPERLHQGFLHHLLLGRLLADPVAGFNSDPAFQLGPGGTGIIDTSQVFYSGGSQGGIFGLAIMGVTSNFTRGFLAVPSANYSTLLHRSVDFNPYLALIRGAYPDYLDQQLATALTQQLWDRADPQGYLPHILSGDLSTPPVPHKILVHMATYDCEVSNLGTEITVRSLGIPQVTPVHRSFFQIPEMAAPFDGSAFVEVDPMRGFSRCSVPGSGSAGAACTTDLDCTAPAVCTTGIPPLTNQAPAFNNGAHGSTGSPQAGQQIENFLRTGGDVQQFCSGPCDNPDLP
jgi:hypothetical protein